MVPFSCQAVGTRVHTANAVSRHFSSAALFGATCVYSSMQQGRGACLGQLGGRAGRSAWAIWRQPPIWTARRYEDPGGQVQCDYCGRRVVLEATLVSLGSKNMSYVAMAVAPKRSWLVGAFHADSKGWSRWQSQLQWWESRRSLKWMPWVCPDPTIPSQRVFFLFWNGLK